MLGNFKRLIARNSGQIKLNGMAQVIPAPFLNYRSKRAMTAGLEHLSNNAADLLAHLEAENRQLRHRAVELALEIQELAEKRGR